MCFYVKLADALFWYNNTIQYCPEKYSNFNTIRTHFWLKFWPELVSAPYIPAHLMWCTKLRNLPPPRGVPYNLVCIILVKLLSFRSLSQIHFCWRKNSSTTIVTYCSTLQLKETHSWNTKSAYCKHWLALWTFLPWSGCYSSEFIVSKLIMWAYSACLFHPMFSVSPTLNFS